MADLVLNIERASVGTLRGQRRHDQRIDGRTNHDPARTHLNRVLVGTGDPEADALAVMRKHRAKARADNDRPFDRLVLSASPDALRTPEQVEAFTGKALAWLRATWGPGVAYATLHLDEETPHIHAVVVPLYQQTLTRKKRDGSSSISTAWKVSHKQHPATRGKDSYKRLRLTACKALGLGYGVPGGKPKAQALAEAQRAQEAAQSRAGAIVKAARKEAAQIIAQATAAAQSVAQERLALDRDRAKVVRLGRALEALAKQQGQAKRAQAIRASVAPILPPRPGGAR